MSSSQSFTLVPFEPREAPDVTLTGTVTRQGEKLQLVYELQGDLSHVQSAAPHNWPIRKHDLWQTTCFELFFAEPNASNYWEVNLSPSGDWNLYRFSGYREGMQLEDKVSQLRSRDQRDFNCLEMTFELDLSLLLPPDSPLELGICAVLQGRDRTLSYWALTHPDTAADFHDRAGFALEI